MALVEYLPQAAVDGRSEPPLTVAVGATVTIVERGTNTPLTLVDANGLAVANPLSVTSLGYIPGFWIDDGPDIVEAWSGEFRTPLWSPTGQTQRAIAAETSAATSATAAATSAQAAVNAAALVEAPTDVAVSGLIDTDGTLTRDAVVRATSTMADDAAAGLVFTPGTQTNAAVQSVASGVVTTALEPHVEIQATVEAATDAPTPDTLARRDGNGSLRVAAAGAADHAVTKAQLDTGLAGKVTSDGTVTAIVAKTQAEYNALVSAGTVSATTYYVVTA